MKQTLNRRRAAPPRWTTGMTAALLAGLVSAATVAGARNTEEVVLSNGMKVIVQEDHRSPVVVSQVWYRAGSVDEFNGSTGVAHVLEHMMFKGTKAIPAGEFSKIIAAAGGRDNAFTSHDHTTYFQQLQKSKLELALSMEADRMRNLTFSDKEFAPEIKVIMEERRLRTDDKPHAILHEQMMAQAFIEHPYHHPVIGWMNDLENMKLADAKDWYDRWYAPNNAVLVVVGDVEAQAVLKLAQKYFGPLKMQALPERKPQLEPPQLGTRRLVAKAPAQFPYLIMAYRVPALRDPKTDPDVYALDVLSSVLDGNDSARLQKALVRETQIASNVGAGYETVERGPALFTLEGIPSEGKTAADLEGAIREQVDRIKRDGVTQDELDRVKAQVIASQVFQRDSMFYQAMQIGTMETAGLSHKDLDTLLERIKQVTAEQVKDVANRYLVDETLTVAVLDPQPLEGRRPATPLEGMRHAQ